MDRREERGLLDTVRWISAGMVALGHAWVCVFARQDNPVSKALWALADTRHSWVIIFFVLSGYLVGGNVLLRADRFDFKRYAVARFTRIYIVLIPALLLTAALDGTAFLIAPHSPVYNTAWGESVFGGTPPFTLYGLPNIAASILCLENVIAPAMGSDGPLWSLGFEWVFYFAFPVLLLAADAIAKVTRLSPWITRTVVMAASVALLAKGHILYGAVLWTIWVCGALAHVVVETDRWPRLLRWAGALICVAGFVVSFRINYRFADVLIGLGAASFLCLFPRGERGFKAGMDQALASGSYTLYVIHLPILAFITLFYNGVGWLPVGGAPISATSMGMYAGMAAIVGLWVVIFQRLFESRTEALRAALSPKPRQKPH